MIRIQVFKNSKVNGNVVAGDYKPNLGEDEIEKLIDKILSAQQVNMISDEKEILTSYMKWLISNTSTFTIPGLKVPLPITEAWVRSKVLLDDKTFVKPETFKAQLAAYREWERLSRDDDTFDAEDVIELGYRVIVIGGPGSGKSTLLRRVAHQLTVAGQKVVFVRLPLVAKRLQQGIRIEDALLETALDGSGIEAGKFKMLLPPDCILADGLDECGFYRGQITEALTKIASVWHTVRIIIATRPIGYDPAQFYDWIHAELLPLDRSAIEKYGEKIMHIVLSNSEVCDLKAEKFNEELLANRVASLAARSPLLLGFLLGLFLDGETLGSSRVCIYRQILELWLRRGTRDSGIELDESTARRSLEIIGWLLLYNLEQGTDYTDIVLIKDVGEALGKELGMPGLASIKLAEQCIRYWQELGVIEHLTFGTQGAYTFVHLTLGEYAAANYIATLEHDEISEWLRKAYKKPYWRETILLAAGIGKVDLIVNELLHMENPNDPVATAHELAAATLKETAASTSLWRAVFDVLAERLKSPVPNVAYEAAQLVSDMPTENRFYAAKLMQPLLSHEQEWTRLAALKVLLACGDEHMDFGVLKNCLLSGCPKIYRAKTWFDSLRAWMIWNGVVCDGISLLAKRQPVDAVKLIKQLFDDGNISAHTEQVLQNALIELGHEEVAKEYFSNLFSPLKGISKLSMEPIRRADKAFLDSVRRCVNENDGNNDQIDGHRFFSIGILYTALFDPQKTIPSDYLAIGKPGREQILDAVIKGLITALGISKTVFKEEVERLLEKIENEKLVAGNQLSLIDVLPRVPINIDWQRGNVDGLLTENLVRALSHPSRNVAIAAAKLLAARSDENIAGLTEELLQYGHEQELKILAKIARFVWGKDAGKILLSRLEGEHSEGVQWLYEEIPEVVVEDDRKRLLKVMVRGLKSQDEQTVIGVAKGLNKMNAADLSSITGEIKETLKYWLERDFYCKECEVLFRGSSCPKCHVVPNSPEADLIRALNKVEGMTFEELTNILYVDVHVHDVIKAAKEGIVSLLTKNPALMVQSLDGVAQGNYSVQVLEAIFLMEAQYLVKVEDEILKLLDLNNFYIKSTIIDSLGDAVWISKEKAEAVLRKKIDDKDPGIRNQAVEVLRKLRIKE